MFYLTSLSTSFSVYRDCRIISNFLINIKDHLQFSWVGWAAGVSVARLWHKHFLYFCCKTKAYYFLYILSEISLLFSLSTLLPVPSPQSSVWIYVFMPSHSTFNMASLRAEAQQSCTHSSELFPCMFNFTPCFTFLYNS